MARIRLRLLISVLAFFVLAPPAPLADTPDDRSEIDAGRRVYQRCIGCHSPERNRTGPLHCGIIGRISGSVDGFAFSEAMRDAGITWTARTLDQFLASPLDTVPGTTMGFAGIEDATERMQVIAWLEALNAASPLCESISD